VTPVVPIALLVVVAFAHWVNWGGDIDELLGPARHLVTGRPPTSADLVNYPPTTFVLYAPLGLVPAGAVKPLAQLCSVLLLAVVVYTWGKPPGRRASTWLALLLLSPPAIDLVAVGQVNTAIGVGTLSWALLALERAQPIRCGLLMAITLVTRPFNTIPIAAGAVFFNDARIRQWKAVPAFIGCLAAIGLVAWRWDGALAVDFMRTGGERPLYGVVGFGRLVLGTGGILAVIMLTATAAGILGRRVAKASSDVDGAAVIVALSILAVHFGGPYVSVYAYPAIARLTARTGSPRWCVSFFYLYSAAFLLVAATDLWAPANGWRLVVDLAFIGLPAITAVVVAMLLVRVTSPPAREAATGPAP
jgi:hypothetical protein